MHLNTHCGIFRVCGPVVFCSYNPQTGLRIWGQSQTHTHTHLCPVTPFQNAPTPPRASPSSPWSITAASVSQHNYPDYMRATVKLWLLVLPSLSSFLLYIYINILFFHKHILSRATLCFVSPLWCQVHLGPFHQPPQVVYEAYAADMMEVSKEFCHDRLYFPRYYWLMTFWWHSQHNIYQLSYLVL